MMTSRRVFCAALVMALTTFATGGAMDPKVLPSDTELVLTINLKQILESPLLKANKEAVDYYIGVLEDQWSDKPAMQMLKTAGFNPFRDLKSVTLTTNGSKDISAIIVEGKFNTSKFAAAVEDLARENPDALSITKSGGQTYYEITPPGEKALYATLIEGKTLIANSSKEELTAAMARLAGTKSNNLKRDFAALLSTANEKQSFSLVATGSALSKLLENAPVPNAAAAGKALGSIDGLAASVTVFKNIDFQLGVNAKDEAAAKKMAKDWNGIIPFAQIMIDNQAQRDEKFAPLSDIVKTLNITSKGNNVLLKGTISVDVIEALMTNIPQ